MTFRLPLSADGKLFSPVPIFKIFVLQEICLFENMLHLLLRDKVFLTLANIKVR
jgi:hypothetical protein